MTTAGTVKRNSAAHVALLVMKMLKRPVELDEFTFISAKKLSKSHRTQCITRLVQLGYAVDAGSSPNAYAITRSGLDVISRLANAELNK